MSELFRFKGDHNFSAFARAIHSPPFIHRLKCVGSQGSVLVRVNFFLRDIYLSISHSCLKLNDGTVA